MLGQSPQRTVLAALLLVASYGILPSTALAHEGTDFREDPQDDFAKKAILDQDGLLPGAYTGPPCPLTDILSVQTTAFHEATSSLDFDGTLVELQMANLTMNPRDCIQDGGVRLVYAFRVRPANHERVTVWVGFQVVDDEWKAWPRATVDGKGIFFPPALQDLDRPDGTVTLAVPTAAEPPYRHVEAYAVTTLCVTSTLPCIITSEETTEASHVDVVPNVLEPEWTLYADDSERPIGG